MSKEEEEIQQTPPRLDYAWSLPGHLLEKPGARPGAPEVWLYCDKFSYDADSHVSVMVHTTELSFELEVVRDGLQPKTVLLLRDLPGQRQQTPEDCYTVGCGWEESVTLDLAADAEKWTPGFYLLIARIYPHEGGTDDVKGTPQESEGFFIVKAPQSDQKADLVLIHTTSTIMAYNDWGGANHYRGLPDGHLNDIPATTVSRDRPLARGMLRLPPDAPREGCGPGRWDPGQPPRYPALKWAKAHGFSRHFADAGYASYERPFFVWAEAQGLRVCHLTQHDLHFEPHRLLEGGCTAAVIIGHDEYWTWEMRDAIDAFVDAGGRLARFAGNFAWQVRLEEDDGRQQVCYKDPRADPLYGKNDQRVTTLWDWTPIGRPGAATMGLTASMAGYTLYGAATTRWSGGFQVYRPNHWALAGSDLRYGDVFGCEAGIAAFETDGADYGVRKGLPYPTGEDGAPQNLEIIAMCPAVLGEVDTWGCREPMNAPVDELKSLLSGIYPDGDIPEHQRDREYGAGMVASFTRGKGEVFCAGSTDWVVGLAQGDVFVQTITRNVLRRFCASATNTE